MRGHQHRAQDLARSDEVVEIGAAPPATHRAGACRIERALILAEARVADVDRAAARECLPGAARSGGEHAIEHVDPALDAADDVVGLRSAEHTSELQSLIRISYSVFCLKKKMSSTNI